MSLTALSPLDGRYTSRLDPLRTICSEFGLMRYRVQAELAWFAALANQPQIAELPPLSTDAHQFLQRLASNFSEQDAQAIKTIEATTNHDMKAVEYFIKQQFATHPELSTVKEFIHFACTSEDINNLAYSLMLSQAREKILLPAMDALITQLTTLAHHHASAPMLARTHGQPATPTTVGKEFANLVYRLREQQKRFAAVKLYGKLNGAVGNFNAHFCAYPTVNWPQLTRSVVESLNLAWHPYTTQILPHDDIAEYAQALSRFNQVLIDLDRDLWGYISLGIFQQKMLAHEVGSSTMPHKVNPIDFENSEGNLGLANALCDFLARQLPVSRWQRDLVDSTVLRNLGVMLGHSVLAYQGTLKGLSKLALNTDKLQQDLQQHWEVLAEPVQTVMRLAGIADPYEQLKTFTRGKILNKTMLQDYIHSLDISAELKTRLLELTPENYLGNAVQKAEEI